MESNIHALKTAIDKAWNEISSSVMQCLINSMEQHALETYVVQLII